MLFFNFHVIAELKLDLHTLPKSSSVLLLAIIITKALVRGWRQSHCGSGTVMISDRTGSQSEEGIKLLTLSKSAAPSLRSPATCSRPEETAPEVNRYTLLHPPDANFITG